MIKLIRRICLFLIVILRANNSISQTFEYPDSNQIRELKIRKVIHLSNTWSDDTVIKERFLILDYDDRGRLVLDSGFWNDTLDDITYYIYKKNLLKKEYYLYDDNYDETKPPKFTTEKKYYYYNKRNQLVREKDNSNCTYLYQKDNSILKLEWKKGEKKKDSTIILLNTNRAIRSELFYKEGLVWEREYKYNDNRQLVSKRNYRYDIPNLILYRKEISVDSFAYQNGKVVCEINMQEVGENIEHKYTYHENGLIREIERDNLIITTY